MLLSRFNLKENVSYTLRDKFGETKKLFQPNGLGIHFFKAFGFLPKISFLFGSWNRKLQISNLVTNAGAALVAGRINGFGSPAAATYIAIGTGATAAAAGDTALQAEIASGGGSRVAGTASLVTTDVTNDTAQLVATFTFSSSFAVTESGVLNAASVGTLLARQVFSAINVVSGDSLQVTWKFDVD